MKLWPLAAMLLFTAACSSTDLSPGVDGTWVGTVTTEGNVTTVINESGSVWGGTATLVEEASIGVDAGEVHYMLASIQAIWATEDRIYLLELQPPVVRVYDLDGVHLMDFGSAGQGPGEFQNPMSMGGMRDGRILVRDDGNSRINVFSPDGELLDEWALPSGFMTSRPMVITPDGTVYRCRWIRRSPTGAGDS